MRPIWQIINVDQLGTTTIQNSQLRGNASAEFYHTASIWILPVTQELFVSVPSSVGTGYEAQGQDQEDEHEGDDPHADSYQESTGYETFPRIIIGALTVHHILSTGKRNEYN